MTREMQGMLGLFTLLFIILAVNPRILKNIYSSILGRIVLLAIIIFVSINNVTLGLLVTLCLIIILHRFGNFAEGMDVMGQQPISTPQTIGDDNASANDSTAKIKVQTTLPTVSELKNKFAALDGGNGVDVQSMQQTIMPVDSNKLPISNNNSNDNVQASSQGMLKTTLTENFCAGCTVVPQN